MRDLFKTGVPLLFLSAAAYGIWRRQVSEKGNYSFKGDDSFKEQSSTSFNDHSCTSTVKDRLSELPNDVCLHILSLLSLRDVARLATLSRNLRDECLLLPCLDLEWNEISGMPKHPRHSEEFELYKAAYVKNVAQVFVYYVASTTTMMLLFIGGLVLLLQISICRVFLFGFHVYIIQDGA